MALPPAVTDDRRAPAGRVLAVGAILIAVLLAGLAAWRREPDTVILTLILCGIGLGALRRSHDGRQAVGESAEPKGHQELMSALSLPAILVSDRSLVLAANAAALRVAPGLKLGHPLSLALRSPAVLDAVARVIATGQAEVVEFGSRVATEAAFEVSASILGRADSRGRPGILLMMRDMTAQRRSETMRVDFVANVSHELRTPLATILGFIETLQGPARNDAGARVRFLDIMHGQANRMTRLIDDLLQLSSVELKAHIRPSGSVDLASLVAEMADVMAPLARERGVTLELDLAAERTHVVGDRDELLRLVENLFANAIKYGGAGLVEVGVRPGDEPDVVELVVRDHGPGIAPEHLPRLTERFYRVDVAESRAQGGTGLGLALVKHIVARHRGRLLVESEPGQGAVFRVRLPGAGKAETGLARHDAVGVTQLS